MQSKEVQDRMFNLVAGWSKSGLSQKVYCEQHSIRYHVFHYWFKRYREQHGANVGHGFIPLQVRQSIPDDEQAGIEIIYADGRRLLFHQAVSVDFIKAIMG